MSNLRVFLFSSQKLGQGDIQICSCCGRLLSDSSITHTAHWLYTKDILFRQMDTMCPLEWADRECLFILYCTRDVIYRADLYAEFNFTQTLDGNV